MPPSTESDLPTQRATDLLALAVKSRLLSEAQAQAVSAKLRRKAKASDLAQQLIEDGDLTPFQANKLLAGLWQGLVIGRFRILKPLGRGGMGVVYLAEDTGASGGQAKVALKILPPRKAAAEPRTRARFLREVAIGRELPKAANIARVYETGIVDGIAFIAMEYIPGQTVRSVVASQGPLTAATAARVFRGVAFGLFAVHDKGFIHRDVKPSNIMITPDGPAKLVDFGFALKIGETTSDPGVVGGAGYTLGTFDFIPPEQAANAIAVTPQADQYSLGCSMYFALTGQPPFPGGDPREKMQRHRLEEPTPISAHRPDLPAAFTALVERLMAKLPEDRFKSCADVALALEPWAKIEEAGPVIFADETFDSDDLDQFAAISPVRSRQRVYRRKTSTLLVAVATAVIAAFAAVVLLAIILNKL